MNKEEILEIYKIAKEEVDKINDMNREEQMKEYIKVLENIIKRLLYE